MSAVNRVETRSRMSNGRWQPGAGAEAGTRRPARQRSRPLAADPLRRAAQASRTAFTGCSRMSPVLRGTAAPGAARAGGRGRPGEAGYAPGESGFRTLRRRPAPGSRNAL